MNQKTNFNNNRYYKFNPKNKINAFANVKNLLMIIFLKNVPDIILKTSGKSVGLPDGQMGNSE